MDVDRLTTGEKIAGVSAILLFIFTFFDWFGVKATGAGVSVTSSGGGSAWDALDIIPWIIVLAVIAVLVMVYVKASDAKVDAPLSAIATGLSGLVVLLILYRVISPPDFGSIGGVSFDATRKAGLWLGLLASIAMAYGSYRAMEEEGTSFSDAADRFSGGGGGGDGPSGGPPASPPPPAEPPSAPPPPPPPSPPPPPPSSGV